MKLLVLASTVPAHSDDEVPRFVLDQALAFAEADADLSVDILAPHTTASHGRAWPQPENADSTVVQHRFRYAPRRWEVLTARGIMPALAERKWRVMLLPALIAAQVWALWRLVARAQPDVIYAHWFTPQALAATIVARLTRRPFGFTTHASDVVVWRRFGWLGRLVVRSVVKHASFMTAVSHQTAVKLLDFFEGKRREDVAARLQIVPMGTDIVHVPHEPGDPHHVYIVARLVEKKGIHHLLAAWPRVEAAVPGARLTIAGSGPREQELREQAEHLDVDAHFRGYVTGEAKMAVVAAAGVCVQPSIVASDGDADGLPVSAIEGLAAGRIVVASDASGAQDIITDARDGWVVPAGDEAALAQALITAMTMEPRARAAMQGAARDLAQEMSWFRIANVHLSVIRGAHTGPRADPDREL